MVAKIVSLLGIRGALQLSFSTQMMQMVAFGVVRSASVYNALAATMVLNPLRNNVLRAAMTEHAAKCGISQGALGAMSENLGSISAIFSSMIWARVYAFGVARGNSGLFYLVVAAVAVINGVITTAVIGDKGEK